MRLDQPAGHGLEPKLPQACKAGCEGGFHPGCTLCVEIFISNQLKKVYL